MKAANSQERSTVAALTAFALGMASTANAADKGCSNTSLNGTFAYTSTGAIVSPPDIAGPIAEVGSQNFDGSGRHYRHCNNQLKRQHATLDDRGNIHQ